MKNRKKQDEEAQEIINDLIVAINALNSIEDYVDNKELQRRILILENNKEIIEKVLEEKESYYGGSLANGRIYDGVNPFKNMVDSIKEHISEFLENSFLSGEQPGQTPASLKRELDSAFYPSVEKILEKDKLYLESFVRGEGVLSEIVNSTKEIDEYKIMQEELSKWQHSYNIISSIFKKLIEQKVSDNIVLDKDTILYPLFGKYILFRDATVNKVFKNSEKTIEQILLILESDVSISGIPGEPNPDFYQTLENVLDIKSNSKQKLKQKIAERKISYECGFESIFELLADIDKKINHGNLNAEEYSEAFSKLEHIPEIRYFNSLDNFKKNFRVNQNISKYKSKSCMGSFVALTEINKNFHDSVKNGKIESIENYVEVSKNLFNLIKKEYSSLKDQNFSLSFNYLPIQTDIGVIWEKSILDLHYLTRCLFEKGRCVDAKEIYSVFGDLNKETLDLSEERIESIAYELIPSFHQSNKNLGEKLANAIVAFEILNDESTNDMIRHLNKRYNIVASK